MTTIQKMWGKIKLMYYETQITTDQLKNWAVSEQGKVVAIASILILSNMASYSLGLLSNTKKAEVRLDTTHSQPYYINATTQRSFTTQPSKGKIVASRRGKKYHFVWCAGARTISEKNKRYFSDEAAARRAGLIAASNCAGLK